MQFLADENIEYPVIKILRSNNLNVLAVRGLMKGATDSEILEYAFKEKLILITSDKDFGELTFRLKKPNHGIILLREPSAGIDDKAKILLTALSKLDKDALNKFIVVDRLKIRFRSRL